MGELIFWMVSTSKNQAVEVALLNVAGASGVALGECDGEPCIKVMVVEKTEELLAKIPKTFEGFQVEVDETGEIGALGKATP